jgi:hypothetical protein
MHQGHNPSSEATPGHAKSGFEDIVQQVLRWLNRRLDRSIRLNWRPGNFYIGFEKYIVTRGQNTFFSGFSEFIKFVR